MNYQDIVKKVKPEFEKVINFLENDLTGIRTNRVSPSLVENIVVDYFGQKFPLKQLGTISSQGAREIIIQPWDKSYISAIEKAVSYANLGASPVVDKELIRISFPPLSEEYRKQLIRLLSQKLEQAKISVRQWREKAWKELQDEFKEGNIREDDKFRGKDELQKLIDQYNKKIDEAGEKKRKDIEI